MSPASRPRWLWMHSDLRLTVAAGLTNGFAALTGVPFAYYATLAVLASSARSYGLSLALGRQRVLGSLLGAVVLVVCYHGLHGLPMPLGLAIALGLQRLLGGLWRLEVGYKVGGMIIVMGWLVHSDQFAQWLPLRLFWTVFGIATALLSMRLLWPASALTSGWSGWATLFEQLADQLQNTGEPGAYARLRRQLMEVRAALTPIRDELGGADDDHPVLTLIAGFDETCSRTIGLLNGLRRANRDAGLGAWPLLYTAELAVLQALALRILQWAACLRSRQGEHRHRLPPAPAEPWTLAELCNRSEQLFDDPQLSSAPLDLLAALAVRQQLCAQAIETLQRTEIHWRQATVAGSATEGR